jgi:hypothetical protein
MRGLTSSVNLRVFHIIICSFSGTKCRSESLQVLSVFVPIKPSVLVEYSIEYNDQSAVCGEVCRTTDRHPENPSGNCREIRFQLYLGAYGESVRWFGEDVYDFLSAVFSGVRRRVDRSMKSAWKKSRDHPDSATFHVTWRKFWLLSTALVRFPVRVLL